MALLIWRTLCFLKILRPDFRDLYHGLVNGHITETDVFRRLKPSEIDAFINCHNDVIHMRETGELRDINVEKLPESLQKSLSDPTIRNAMMTFGGADLLDDHQSRRRSFVFARISRMIDEGTLEKEVLQAHGRGNIIKREN